MARRKSSSGPVRKPEWRQVYDGLLAAADFGRLVTYEELSAVLGRRFMNNRGPIYRARQELGHLRLRWLEAVPQQGYRVIDASEHVRVAGDHKVRGQNQFSKMLEVSRATDLHRLTPDELALYDRQNRINVALFGIVTSHEQRIQRIEEILRADGKM
jgi:hypothetical protein